MCNATEPILLPYQRLWISDRSTVKICEKSRRTGITWATALEAVIVASADATDGGMDVYFMTYREDACKEFIGDCETWAKVFGALHGEAWVDESEGFRHSDSGAMVTVRVLTIEFKNGNRIHALAGRPRSFRGKQGYAIIDEAAFVDDLEGCMKAAVAFTMWGGRVALISTHCGESNPFNVYIGKIRDGEKENWGLHSIPLVEAIDQGLARRIAGVSGAEYSAEWAQRWEADLRSDYGADADEELDCIPSRQGAGYFDPNVVNACRDASLPVVRWVKPREWIDLPQKQREAECDAWLKAHVAPLLIRLHRNKGTCLGVDFARYSDGSVWILGQVDGPVRSCVLTIELSCIPLRQQEQILGFVIAGAPRFMRAHMDKTGNGFALHEWARENRGPMCEGVTIGPKWHDESWPELLRAVSERTTDIPDDDDCAKDFSMVERIDGKPRVAKRRTRGKHATLRHGDFAVAHALMLSASKGLGSRSGASVGSSARSSRHGF